MKLVVLAVLAVIMIVTPSAIAQGTISPGERLQELRQRRGVTIGDDQKEATITRCNKGKLQIVSIQAAGDSAVKKRLAIYGGIQKEIKALELRMTKQGADASEIDLLIGKIQQNLDVFSEEARRAQLLADDIGTIDCTTQYDIYVAATEEYIELRQELYKIADELKSTILNAPDATFHPLIDRLTI